MFTGLVEEIGRVEFVVKSIKSSRITIKAKKIMEGVELGDSISTNGVCLTVTSFDTDRFSVDVMAETMRLSNLSSLNISHHQHGLKCPYYVLPHRRLLI